KECLPDLNADNISLEEFNVSTRVRNNEFPSFLQVKQKIDAMQNLASIQSGIVLCTLRPTVYFGKEGNRNLLTKGTYVVKS
ncbi:MAG: hypothetical protein NZ108_04750, partial [Bacteroidia bacterium]|nr:hypothetical protein [Bacteroidia bacterium]